MNKRVGIVALLLGILLITFTASVSSSTPSGSDILKIINNACNNETGIQTPATPNQLPRVKIFTRNCTAQPAQEELPNPVPKVDVKKLTKFPGLRNGNFTTLKNKFNMTAPAGVNIYRMETNPLELSEPVITEDPNQRGAVTITWTTTTPTNGTVFINGPVAQTARTYEFATEHTVRMTGVNEGEYNFTITSCTQPANGAVRCASRTTPVSISTIENTVAQIEFTTLGWSGENAVVSLPYQEGISIPIRFKVHGTDGSYIALMYVDGINSGQDITCPQGEECTIIWHDITFKRNRYNVTIRTIGGTSNLVSQASVEVQLLKEEPQVQLTGPTLVLRGQPVEVACTVSPTTPVGVTLLRNTELNTNWMQISNPDNSFLPAGHYIYQCQTEETERFYGMSLMKDITVARLTPNFTLKLNTLEYFSSLFPGDEYRIEGILNGPVENVPFVESDAYAELQVYADDRLVYSQTGPRVDTATTFDTAGKHQISLIYSGNENYAPTNITYAGDIWERPAPVEMEIWNLYDNWPTYQENPVKFSTVWMDGSERPMTYLPLENQWIEMENCRQAQFYKDTSLQAEKTVRIGAGCSSGNPFPYSKLTIPLTGSLNGQYLLQGNTSCAGGVFCASGDGYNIKVYLNSPSTGRTELSNIYIHGGSGETFDINTPVTTQEEGATLEVWMTSGPTSLYDYGKLNNLRLIGTNFH